VRLFAVHGFTFVLEVKIHPWNIRRYQKVDSKEPITALTSAKRMPSKFILHSHFTACHPEFLGLEKVTAGH
jgi:hypothetical protein